MAIDQGCKIGKESSVKVLEDKLADNLEQVNKSIQELESRLSRVLGVQTEKSLCEAPNSPAECDLCGSLNQKLQVTLAIKQRISKILELLQI
jgi:hypothetical protein